MNKELNIVAERVVKRMKELQITLSTAESCTGGAIASAITSVPGSSKIFMGSVVAYSNNVKHRALSVPLELIAEQGAVSSAVVEAMAIGVRDLTESNCAVATSGIAGPDGGTDEKPVGTVWVAVNVLGEVTTHLIQIKNKGRDENICTFAKSVLSLLLERLQNIHCTIG